MKFNFIFLEELKKLTGKNKTAFETQGCTLRGRVIYINLGAFQWMYLNNNFNEDKIIKAMTEVIIHEYIHNEIGKVFGNDIDLLPNEERICNIMSGREKISKKIGKIERFKY